MFNFEGNEILVSYAKYLIEYLDFSARPDVSDRTHLKPMTPRVQIERLERDLAETQAEMYRCQEELRTARMVLRDAVEDGGSRGRLIELEEALHAMVDLLTKQTPREGPSIYETYNPYSRPQVKRAIRVLGIEF